MGELRRRNLIDIIYQKGGSGPGEFSVSATHKMLPLYSPEVLEEEFDRIQTKYGEERLERARKYAEIVFKENDARVVEEIINMINEHGEKKVRRAFFIVRKKQVANPKRCYSYVKGIIQNLIDSEEGKDK